MSGRILQGSTAGGSNSHADAAVLNARRQSTISQTYTQSEYSESELGEQDNTWDDWEDEEGMSGADPKCLFCSLTFESAREVFVHCTKAHGFNFLKTRQTLGLDFYQSIRLINYLRRQSEKNPLEAEKTLSWSVAKEAEFLQDDEYLRPVIEDDSLLFEFEDLEIEDDAEEGHNHSHENEVLLPQGDALKRPESQWSKIETKTDLEAQLLKELRLAEEKLFAAEVQLSQTEAQFEEYRTRVKASFFDNLVASAPEVSTAAKDGSEDDEPDSVVVPEDEGNYYFNSYAHSGIHQQMLNDRVRTEGYRDFIYENKDVFKGKTVLDVGCGTGILSMFAARAGATRVLSVDNSDIIEKARKNIVENGLQDVITLYRGKIEEIKLPCKVDIIISEWMGYFLLYEAMLDSVLVARDRFLNPGGILAPSQTRILMTASSDEAFLEESIHYWNDVYGFKMSTMKDNVLQEAVVDFVSPETLVTDTICLKDLPHQEITVAGLDFITDFELTMQRDDHISAFVGYFDTWFTRDGHTVPLDVGIEKKELQKLGLNGFTTGPVYTRSEETHWKQTMFVLEKALVLQKGDRVKGTFYCHKNHMNPRALDLRIVYEVIKKDGSDVSAQDGMKADLKFYLR